MAYDSKIRHTAQAFFLAGYRHSDVRGQLLELFNIDVPASTLSLWKSNIVEDDQIALEAEEYRKKHADLCWFNIGQANRLLQENLHSALYDRKKIDAAIAHIAELDARDMFDEEHVSKIQEAIDILTSCKALTSTRDALSVVKDLGAMQERSAAAGNLSGTFQISFDSDLEELSD